MSSKNTRITRRKYGLNASFITDWKVEGALVKKKEEVGGGGRERGYLYLLGGRAGRA